MATCKINFTKKSNPLAYGIYQDLLEAGASCEALDYGYNVTNYAGLYCPKKDARSCVKGKGDGVVEADEVTEYALDNYEQAKYRQIIEGRLGEPLPWVLDDLDPNTTDDNDIREKVVQPAINELKRIILSQGIAENSEKYKEMLAAGLTWFVAVPDKTAIKKALQSPDWKRIIDGLEGDGLGEFVEYLKANGGIRVEGDYSEEYTALEALKNKRGECSEISYILFAAMKMAKLRPIFIYEAILKEETNDPIIKAAIKDMPRGAIFFHLCIGLYTGKGIRLFDSMLVNSNANYRLYTPLSLGQCLGSYYSGRGGIWREKGELDRAIADDTRAIEIDPKNTMAYSNRGGALAGQGNLDEAITDYTRAIEIDPKFAVAYTNRGVALAGQGKLDEAMADYTRAIEIDPKLAMAYDNRGVAWASKGKLDKAIADFTRAIELDPKFASAYNNRGLVWEIKGEFDKAIADMAKATVLDQTYVKNLLITTRKKWQSSEELKNSASLFRDEMGGNDISEWEVWLAFSYALWELESQKMAKGKLKDALYPYLNLKNKPSKPIADFFKDMLARMPASMKKDKDVQENLKSLREKIK